MARETAPSVWTEANRVVKLAVSDYFPEEWTQETGFDESQLPDLNLVQRRQLAQEISQMQKGLNAPTPIFDRINRIFEKGIENPYLTGAGLLGLLAYHYGLLGFIGLGATVEDSEPANNFGFLKDPHKELYPCAWIGTRMREEARKAILDHVNKALASNGYPDAGRFINYSVYGSGASYNWDEDGDFDMQMWVDADKYNEGRDDPMTEDDLVADIRRIVQTVNFPSFADLGLKRPDCEGRMLVQYYAKPGKGTKEENLASKPYACFDLEKDIWYQKPKPITPEFYGEWFILLEPKAKDIATQASAVLESLERNVVEWSFWSQMYERHHDPRFKEIADKAKQDAIDDKEGAHNMFLNIFQGRAKAYSPEGEGSNDERDLMEKLLEVWGIFQRLRHATKEPLPWDEQELPEELPIEEPKERESRWHFESNLRIEFQPYDPKEHDLPLHAFYAFDGDKEVGYLYVDANTNTISDVNVPEEYQRQGIATALLEDARAELGEIKHSDDLTPAGLGWSKAVGSWRLSADATKVSEAVHSIMSSGGGTFHQDLSPVNHHNGYYVSVHGYEQQVSMDDFGESTLQAYLDATQGHPGYFLGAWVDNGLVYLDLTKHIDDKHEAIEFGLYNRQQAIWDIANQQAIELDPEKFSPSPAFSKVAAWKDLMEKAKRLKDQGRVHILNNQPDHVIGRVEGDHGTYTTQIWRQDPQSQAITMWDCECPWDQYAWQRTRQWKKYEGRPCSHVLALYWTAQQNAAQQPQVPEGQMTLPGMTPTPQAPPPVPYQPGPPNLEGENLPRPGQEPALPRGPFAPTPTPADMPVSPQVAPGQPPMQPVAPGMQIDPRVLRTAPGVPTDPRYIAPATPGGNSQPQPPGQGGTFGFPGALSNWRFRLSSFENGTIVRAEAPLVGMDRDGRQWRVPRNSKGEVLSSDEDKTIAIFPLSTGQLQPHLVRVVADTSSFSQSYGSPFIGT